MSRSDCPSPQSLSALSLLMDGLIDRPTPAGAPMGAEGSVPAYVQKEAERSVHSIPAGSRAWRWIGGRGPVGDRSMSWKFSSMVWKFGSIEWNFSSIEWNFSSIRTRRPVAGPVEDSVREKRGGRHDFLRWAPGGRDVIPSYFSGRGSIKCPNAIPLKNPAPPKRGMG